MKPPDALTERASVTILFSEQMRPERIFYAGRTDEETGLLRKILQRMLAGLEEGGHES